jgi:hypothetical protein
MLLLILLFLDCASLFYFANSPYFQYKYRCFLNLAEYIHNIS